MMTPEFVQMFITALSLGFGLALLIVTIRAR